MAKAFKRLQKQVGDRKQFDWRPNLNSRLHNIEVMLYELNCYVIRVIHDSLDPEVGLDGLSEADKSILEAATDFQKHLEQVLKEGKRV